MTKNIGVSRDGPPNVGGKLVGSLLHGLVGLRGVLGLSSIGDFVGESAVAGNRGCGD